MIEKRFLTENAGLKSCRIKNKINVILLFTLKSWKYENILSAQKMHSSTFLFSNSYSFTIRFQWSCTSLILFIIQWQMINARNWLASIFINNCSKLGQFIFHFTFNWWKRPALALTGPCLCTQSQNTSP